MNDFTDDILSDLDDLESSTEALQEHTSQAKSAQQQLASSGSAQSIDAASLALEAAKAAQEAAKQSQNAAESAIKLSNDLKAQIIELSDSNTSWRQTARSAAQDIERSRNTMVVLMSVTVVLGIVTTSLSAWFLYHNSKKQELFKGDVLDLIQTEVILNNKSINLKVDQISSLLEVLSAEIQNLNTSTSVKGSSRNRAAAIEVVERDEVVAEQTVEETVAAPSEPVKSLKLTTPELSAPTTESLPSHLALDPVQLEELKSLINLILDKQQKLEAAMMAQSVTLQHSAKTTKTNIVSAPSNTDAGLTEKQVKQLDGLGWLVRKQEKTLKEIQDSINAASQGSKNQNTQTGFEGIEKSLNELKAQIVNLSTQQKAIETQVIELQEQTKKLSEPPKPYSYQNK